MVEYYGVQIFLNQLFFINVFEVCMFVVMLYDKLVIGDIEKVILKVDLGIILISDGNMI